MDYVDFLVDRAQHMRPLEYDLSENYNELVRYLHDMGVLDNVPVATLGPGEILSVSDVLAAPLRSLVVGGSSTQDGTPTPDAPVPILSVDDLALVLAGKNLLDPTLMKDQVGWNVIRFYAPVGTTFTMSTNCPISSESGLPCFFKTPSESQGTGTQVYSGHPRAKTVPNGGYLEIIQRRSSGTDSFANYEWQIELGSTATTYESYISTTVPDLLPEGTSLRSLPDGTRDTLSLSYLSPSTRAGWAWYARSVTRRITEVTFDGSESWVGPYTSYASGAGYYTRTKLPNNIKNRTHADAHTCNLATGGTGGNSGANTFFFGSAREVDFVGVSGAAPTLADWVALVTATPAVIQYALADAYITTETLDPIELPVLPAPTATVWCDGGSATPQLMVEYIRNLSASISDMQAAIADIISG